MLPERIQQFSTALYQAEYSTTTDDIIMSPLSAQTVLTEIYYGAVGKSATTMANVLRLGNMTSQEILNNFNGLLAPLQQNKAIQMANAIYVKQSYILNASYADLVSSYFDSIVQPVDFAKAKATADTINGWIATKTQNAIQKAVLPSSFTSTTSVLLVNAIYFKGTWQTIFNKRNTFKQPFFKDGYCPRSHEMAVTTKPIELMRVTVNYSSVMQTNYCLL